MVQDEKVLKYQHIGDIAKQLGISSRSIRYYEELGLIVPKRSHGGFREYSGVEIEKLSTILKLKKLSLSLEEIQNLVNMKQCMGNKKSAAELLTCLHKRMHEFEDRIKDYKDGLNEMKNFINIIENCGNCKSPAEVFRCKECLEEQDKEMPQLMKAML